MLNCVIRVVGAVALISGAVLAQAATPPAPTRATAISAVEIADVVARADGGAIADRLLRLLPIGGEYNIAISVVRRSLVDKRTPPDALVHEDISEVYQILEGRGVLVTGGAIEGAQALPADGPIVRNLIGPSSAGRAIVGGVSQMVGPGDVVVIPPHTPHGFSELQAPRIVYLLVRIDPHRVLQPQ